MALQRVTIGFQGSQVLTLKMEDAGPRRAPHGAVGR